MTVLVLACAACTRAGGEQTAGRHPWTVPGFLRVATVDEPKSLNPLLASTTDEGFVDRLMFEPLVTADVRGNPIPMLATTVPTQENGGISSDGLTIVYHLRRDARWSDGVPVGAADVKWSWQAIENPGDNVISRHGYDVVRSIDTPDAKTVVVHLKRRFAPFVNTFFAESDQPYDVAPAHVLAKYPNINRIPFNDAPTVGDGPFLFSSWRHGDSIEVVANPHFFLGRPKLDRIKISIVPDENSATNLLRTHQLDYVFQPSIATYPSLHALPGVRVVFVNMNGYEGVQFNDARVPDPLVRRAAAYALDKAAMVQDLTHGQMHVATEDIPNWMWAFDPTVKSYPYDVREARRALEQAGYRFGPDGMAGKNGRPLDLLLATDTQNVTHRSESLLLQAALHRIGIAVDIKFYPIDVLYESAALGGITQSGRFDVTLGPWYAGIDPDDSSQFLCDTIPPGGYNLSRYCNPQMEAAQRAALMHYDQAIRATAYSRIQRLLARDNPIIFLWWQRQQEAVSVDFKGFAPNPVVESWNAWQWSI